MEILALGHGIAQGLLATLDLSPADLEEGTTVGLAGHVVPVGEPNAVWKTLC